MFTQSSYITLNQRQIIEHRKDLHLFMYSAFIVDDEELVRKGLINYFCWSKHNIVVCGEANNGRDALEQILKNPVDIVISDIRMPFLDGIGLAKALKENNCPAKIIFISGHDDIDYLKSAMKIDAIDYILKSIDLDEFEETIKKVVSIIQSEKATNSLLSQMESRLKKSIPLLQEKLLLTLIRDDVSQSFRLEEKIQFLGLNLKQDIDYCIVVISVRNYYTLYSQKCEHERQQLSIAVLSICEETIKQNTEGIVFESGLGEFTIVLPVEQETYETMLLHITKRLQQTLKDTLEMMVKIGISERQKGVYNFRDSYQNALSSILRNSSLGTNDSVTINRDPDNETKRAMYQIEETFLAALNARDFSKAKIILSAMLTEIETIKDESEMQNALFHILILPERALNSQRVRKKSPYENMRLLCEQFFCCYDTKEMSAYVLSVYGKVESLLDSQNETQTDVVIAHIKKIINERFTETLTINELAEAVYLTPTYVCLLFKQETGTTINEYLTLLRIEYGKKLLADPGMKLYDVCYALGYTSPSYFSRLYKKHTGLSPSEYRDKITAAFIADEQ